MTCEHTKHRSKAEVLAAIADDSIFGTAELGRTKRIKAERVDQLIETVANKILFVGPPRPLIVVTAPAASHDLHGYGRGSGTYSGD